MTTTSHVASAAEGSTGAMVNGIHLPYFAFAGIGNADECGSEAAFVHVMAIRGLSSAQPHIGIERFADEGLVVPASVVGGAS